MKRSVLFLVSLLVVTTMVAAPVSQQRAIQVAQQFIPVSDGPAQAPGMRVEEQPANVVYTHLMPKSGRPAFYVVNVDGSFVIVSADDVAHQVLGYNLGKNWPVSEQIPPQVKGFFDDLAAQMEAAIEANPNHASDAEWSQPQSAPQRRMMSEMPDSVGPLLTTTWDQGQYYNALCPEDQNSPYDGHCLTGCVATAMAQIINYWGYPIHGRGIHSYETNYGTLTVNYDSAHYDFAHMPAQLTNTSTPQEIQAVATLMRDCGVAANMEYDFGESTAYPIDARAALINFFQFNPGLNYVNKNNYSDEQWDNILKTDISKNQPVIYSGYSQLGHTFICDGYKQDGYFHFNFGWGGYADGWFLTSAVLGFDSNQNAIIEIHPDSTGNVIVGQTVGKSTYYVETPLFFTSPVYSDYYDFNGGNTVTFNSKDNNSHLMCDVLDYDESVVQYITITDRIGFYRYLSYNGFGNNDFSTIETNDNMIKFDLNGHYSGGNGFQFYIQRDNGCSMASSVTLNSVDDGTGTSVSIGWRDNASVGPWQIRYRSYGSPVDSATIISVSTNPYVISGLSSGKLYFFSVRNQCGIDANIWSHENSIVVDIPHWTDIVTEQPVGYMEDANGNVEISSAEGLAWLSVKTNGLHNQMKEDFLNKRVRLITDINLDGYRWYPIAANAVHSEAAFRGVFDGGNHVISNINIIEDKTQRCGLFALFEGDTIKNVRLSNGVIHNLFYNVPEQGNSGGIVGLCFNGSIENCYSGVDVYGVCRVGSLCGGTYGKIINSSSTGNVYGRTLFGGLLGHAGPGSEIMNCYSTGNALSNFYVTPSDCFYQLIYRGGLIGYAENSNFQNCYAVGNVETETGGQYCGTLIGGASYNTNIKLLFGLPNVNFEKIGDIDNSVVITDVSDFSVDNNTCLLETPINVGGIEYTDMVAAMNARIVENNNSSFKLWVNDTLNINGGYPVYGDYYEPSCYNPTTLTVSQATLIGNDTIRTRFAWNQVGEPNSWELLYVTSRHSMDEGTIIPINSNPCVLTNIPVGNPLDFYVRAICSNNDTSGWSEPITYIPDKLYWTDVVTTQPEGYQIDDNGHIHIYSAEALAWLSQDAMNQYDEQVISLESDVDLSQYRWHPICDNNHSFRGIFNGKGHVINGLYCNDLKDGMGLFGYVGSGSIIKNVNVYNCYIAGTSYVSALTPNAWEGQIINCGASGELHAWAVAAGIVADAPFSTVKNSFFNGSITYREDMYCYLIPGYFGGVANHVETIENCYFSGEIPDMSSCGLITFTANSVDTINNCYSLYNDSGLPFTIDIPATNLSYFTGLGNTWTLSNPSFINGVYYPDLVDALNAWVDANNEDSTYRYWVADTAMINGGFPIFAPMPVEPVGPGTEIGNYKETNRPARKVFERGQLYIILPDGTRYDATGKKVK